jgi:photosystem II stability/assembly factor-like uncharacterized protein
MRNRCGLAGASLCALLSLTSVAVLSNVHVAAEAGQAKPAAAAAAAQPKFKAIWEPVNVPEDLDLLSVHFVSADVGWVAGGKSGAGGGVVYHTTDGGMTWQLQTGDPQSSDGVIQELQFVDPTHGFAVQDTTGTTDSLLSTSDGKTWAPSGTVPEHRYALWFINPTTGFVADPNRRVLRTVDGGKKWQPVWDCRIKAEIGGLTREATCYVYGIHFPTATTGYALGGPLPENGGNVLARTDDGGTTWNAWVILPGVSAQESSLRFVDANNGVLRGKDGKMFRTADGGRTWMAVTGQAQLKSELSFANAETGWMIYYKLMTYTSNSGRSWVSREINFPTMVSDSILVQPDRGYAVGQHGMVYRYRIVPIDYTVKGMIAAPAIAAR